MKLSLLSTLSLVSIAAGAGASSSPTSCGNGRTASIATCCIWYSVLDDIQDLFERQCGDDAHDALRLSFHDAIGFSPKLNSQQQFGGGGADGSLIKFAATELAYASNEGLESIVFAEKDIADKYGVSYGDIIQFAAAVSVRNCPGGPHISFLAGRPNAIQAAPDGLVPNPFDSVDTILSRVEDAGLTSDELVNLLASHSVAVQEHVDESIPGTPFDLTPGVFDNNFYRDVLLPGVIIPGPLLGFGFTLHKGEVKAPFIGEFRLQSDFALARDPRTASRWKSLGSNQSLMESSFATAMAKMALLGQDAGILHDCSDVIS
ncbi:putative peroxidase [Mycena alexandri]|uniref:Peroxidase n=1 Tax=Mycena alexandri TaxID=1745969 RepID=A0AAD6SMX7_9AGAR|nr:putative peroxidase [Mycena alexandri]